MVFENNNKIQDTVLIYLNYPKGFEPNFDFWWNRKITKHDTVSTKRNFGKQFVTYSNYEKNKYKKANLNLNLFLYYTKTEKDSGLILRTDAFKEKYNLNKYSLNDTLVFKDKENASLNCNNENCLKKIKYLKSSGIIYLEKGNGEVWILK